MSDFITVEEAIELVYSKVDMCPRRNQKDLFDLLSIVNESFWRKGKWDGMTKEFYVNVRPDGTIVNPPGFNVLLGINLDGAPAIIRDHYYQFHRNGPGTLDGTCGDGNWTKAVIDLGRSPVIVQPINDPHDPCNPTGCERAFIGVSGSGCEEETAKAIIEGTYPTGHPIVSYFQVDTHGKRILQPVPEGQVQDLTTETRYGVEFQIGKTVQKVCNVYWQTVTAINKTPTRGMVKVWAMYDNNRIKLIAELEPHETSSNYRRYQLPDRCRQPCVLGMFKMSKPQKITMGTQRMVVNSSEAILAMAMANDLWYNKRQPGQSVPFERKALSAVLEVQEENRSNAEVPLQFHDVKAEAEIPGLGQFY